MSQELLPKLDIFYLFENARGILNMDPDGDGDPRLTDEGHAFVSTPCLTRGVREMILRKQEAGELLEKGYGLHVRRGVPIADETARVVSEVNPEIAENAKSFDSQNKTRSAICGAFYDDRMFGHVGTNKDFPTGESIRGAVQIGIAMSIDPVEVQQMAVTRMAPDSSKEEGDRTMGRKSFVPYALYWGRAHFSPHDARKNGVTARDLEIFFQAFSQMFDNVYRSGSRGYSALREMIVCKHSSPLGNMPSHDFYDRITVTRDEPQAPAQCYKDYTVALTDKDLPPGVEILKLEQILADPSCVSSCISREGV